MCRWIDFPKSKNNRFINNEIAGKKRVIRYVKNVIVFKMKY